MLDKSYSVLMSVYHKENPIFLKTSIESMMNQTLKPNEIVIVKDGVLNEGLDEVIVYYKRRNPDLFKVVTLEKNVGLAKALNAGLENCTNELVARMDTDDIAIKERCELQIEEFMKNNELSIVGTMIDEFYDDPSDIISSRLVPCKHEDIVKFSKRRNPFNHPTVMYKKSEVLGCGGYGDYRRNQDLDLFVRMLNSGHIALNINKSLLLFRANKDNLKRRKSLGKCKSYVKLIYNFWKRGHSNMSDVLIVAVSQLIILISPMWVLKWVSNVFLRSNINSKREKEDLYEY
ncbi:glycosyltransferase [Salibacterium salarium]|uniref:Glycosyltransferase n=1 Tax=Salibacterium salarium TaxID=284579 RepID=A0A428MUE8_9BACI|nr:glycosyltransferase [Salibacterium salarium]RSL29764.1 glycosyltransferase [Salibacterium salarium]